MKIFLDGLAWIIDSIFGVLLAIVLFTVVAVIAVMTLPGVIFGWAGDRIDKRETPSGKV